MGIYRVFRSSLRRVICPVLVIVMLLVGGCSSITGDRTATPGVASVPPAGAPPLTSFSGVVKDIMASVVYIFVLVDIGTDTPIDQAGSGVIMTQDGYILTNKHVIEDAQTIEVTLQDRQVYQATGVWSDDLFDLAVVKIDGKGLPAAKFGDPARIRIGDLVVAVGHPLGLSPKEGGATVTAGIISNLNRSFSLLDIPYYDIIQTDAAINPGNSGGPLVNMNGEVIGINSVGTSAQNIGFAINVIIASHVFEDLVKYGRSYHPYIGIAVDDITPANACTLCLTQRIGAVITEIDPNSPAAEAGLKVGDIVLRFDGEEITLAATFVRALWRHEPERAVKMVIWRDGKETEVEVTPKLRDEDSLPLVNRVLLIA